MRPKGQGFGDLRDEMKGFEKGEKRGFRLVQGRADARFQLMARDANGAGLAGARLFASMRVEGHGPTRDQQGQSDERAEYAVIRHAAFVDRAEFYCKLFAERADAEEFQRVGDVLVTHLSDQAFQLGHEAVVLEILHLGALAADDVVMMLVAVPKLVARHPVAEVAAADEIDLLELGQAAIDGNQVARRLFAQIFSEFLDGEGSVPLVEEAE